MNVLPSDLFLLVFIPNRPSELNNRGLNLGPGIRLLGMVKFKLNRSRNVRAKSNEYHSTESYFLKSFLRCRRKSIVSSPMSRMTRTIELIKENQ